MPLAAAAAISAGAAIYGAHKQSSAARSASHDQIAAAANAANLQKQSSDEALSYERDQAAEDKRRYDESQQRNYEQYLRRYRAAQALGKTINFDMPDAPDYYTSKASGPGGGPSIAALMGGGGPPGSAPPPSGNPMDRDYIKQQVTAELAKHGQKPTGRGTGPGDVEYWADQIQKGKGWEPYWQEKIAGAFNGANSARPQSGSPMSSRGVSAYLNPALGGGPAPAQPDFRLRSIYANL